MSEQDGASNGAENQQEDHSEAEAALSAAMGEGESSGNASSSSDDAARRLAQLERERDEWKSHARKHEQRYKEATAQLKSSRTEQERLAELEKAVTAAELERLEERSQNALTQVQLRLAEAGIKSEDVAGLMDLVNPTALLKDGKPNGEAIKKFSESLIKIATRATPDPDQGRSSSNRGPVSMNDLIRRAAGVQT